jgi:hypothetical protein
MGGTGSGTWYRSGRKRAAEECLVFDVSDFTDRFHAQSSGIFSWVWPLGHTSEVTFEVAWSNGNPTVTLRYQWSNCERISICIPLESTPTNFNGRRWWFRCPLNADGINCNRRSKKLYLAPGSRHFACRLCHNLTYRSSREAHRENFFWRYRRSM